MEVQKQFRKRDGEESENYQAGKRTKRMRERKDDEEEDRKKTERREKRTI